MNCRSAKDQIQKSLDTALTPGEGARLDAHLASCAACRQARDEHRRLARAARRWARPQPEDDPGDAFTAEVLARIAARPARVPTRSLVWMPLAATSLLLALLLRLPGLLRPSLDSVGIAALQTPGWLAANLRGVPGDALVVWSTLTTGVSLPPWAWAALLAAAVVNGMLCIQARQTRIQRSLP